MTPAHLYVHVPFCLRRCTYCDFAVQPGRRPDVAGWQTAIRRELELQFAQNGWQRGAPLRTIYVGGGTPSLLGTGGMTALRDTLREFYTLESLREWTAEANPESFTRELGEEWRGAGVDRLSLGIQTFHAPALRWMGRLHGPDGARTSFQAARAAGFENISVDLIFALPERLGRDWRSDLEAVLSLNPEHVSLYGLTAESGTALGRWVEAGRERVASEDTYSAQYLLAAELLGAGGFEHYEVSNFGLPGRRSQHNSAYWSGAAYLGLGPGAHSYLPPARSWNVRDWRTYQTMLEAGQLPRDGDEVVEAAELEGIWLGLRTVDGLELAAWPEAVADQLRAWVEPGWVEVAEGRARLTPTGWLLLDQLAVELEGVAKRRGVAQA